MVNITHKSNTLRKAIATAIVTVSKQQTIDAINNRKIPKGDVFEFARAAGLLAIKKTSNVIPDCHPIPVEFASITYDVSGLNIIIKVEAHTIYKTGIEVECMHGAAITAITMYDMLKPVDKSVIISTIQLENKSGGKSDYADEVPFIKCAVVVCSDSVKSGKKEDRSGQVVIDKLQQHYITNTHYDIIPDDKNLIQEKLKNYVTEGYQLVLFIGGTGLSPKDVTPEAVKPMLDRDIPGIMEAARNYGQQRTPYAMLSRGVAGFIKECLVVTLPGSTKGAAETMDALFPYLLHLFSVAKGPAYRH